MKRCPFCVEEIQDAAVVCRYCNRDLPKAQRAPAMSGGIVVDEGFPLAPAPTPQRQPGAKTTATPAQRASDAKTRRYVIIASVAVIVVYALSALGTWLNGPADNKQALAAAPPPVAAPDPPKPVEHPYSSDNAIVQSLTNRNISPTINRGKTIEVFWAVGDGLFMSMTRSAVKGNIANILRWASVHGGDYKTLRLTGTFTLEDTFGNTREEPVVRAEYSRETVDKINWQGFNRDNVYKLADNVELHREMRDQ